MNDNIYAEIVESDQVVSKLRGKLPTMFESLAYSKSGDNPSQPKKPAKKFLGLTSRDESELQNQHLQQKKMLQQKRYMIHIDSVNKVSQASMLGSSFIVYRIRFTRMSDLESRSTWKRFRDMQSWYQEVGALIYCFIMLRPQPYNHSVTSSQYSCRNTSRQPPRAHSPRVTPLGYRRVTRKTLIANSC